MFGLDGNVMDTLSAFEDWSMLDLPFDLKFHSKVLRWGHVPLNRHRLDQTAVMGF